MLFGSVGSAMMTIIQRAEEDLDHLRTSPPLNQGRRNGGPNAWTVEACASKSDGLVTSPGTGGGIASSGPKLLRSTIRFRGVTRLYVKGAHRWGVLCKWDADNDSLADVAGQRNSSLTLPHSWYW
ncbi:hypothetical protein BN1708_014198, partial [Verticillium longisporum]